MVACDPLAALGVATYLLGREDQRGDGAGATPRTRSAAVLAAAAGGTTLATLLAVSFGAEQILRVLDLSAGSVELAAAIVLTVPASLAIARGDRRALAAANQVMGARGTMVPITFPILAGPAPVLVALSIAATRGTAMAAGAVALVALAVGGLLATAPRSTANRYPVRLHAVGGRLTGVAMLAVALALAVEGILGY